MCRKCRDIFNTAQVIGGVILKYLFLLTLSLSRMAQITFFWEWGLSPLSPLQSGGVRPNQIAVYRPLQNPLQNPSERPK